MTTIENWALALALGCAACGTSDVLPDVPPIVATGGGGNAGMAGTASAGIPSVGGSSGTSAGGSAGTSAVGLAGDGGHAGGAGVVISGDGGASGAGGPEPAIPPLPASCPTIAEGEITVLGQKVLIWTGPAGKKGPLLFYWHGSRAEADQALEGVAPALEDVRANGGVVASFTTSTNEGALSGPKVWHVSDFDMTDIILACGVEQGLVDPRQVYTAGCSAGALQSSVMVYLRSSYLAAAMPNSGGLLRTWALEDPAHVPALITTHGGAKDFVNISFAEATAKLDEDILAKGGFVVNCDHGGGHCKSPDSVKHAQWKFLKAHPFGVEPEPYANGLPASFPEICQIVE